MINVSDPVNHPYSYKLSLSRGNFWIQLHRILLPFETIKMLVINYLQTNFVSNKNEPFSQIPVSHLSQGWRTGKPGVLQSMGLQRVGHSLATEQQHNYILAIINNAAMNIGVCGSFKISALYVYIHIYTSVQFSSVTQLCPTLCDPMNRSTPGLPVHHQLLQFTQTQVRWVGDAISSSVHPLSFSNHLILCRPLLLLPSIFCSITVFSSESALRISGQSLEFQLQHQSFQWTPRTDLL